MNNERYEKSNTRQPQIVETFEKKFGTFTEGLEAIKKLHPFIEDLFDTEDPDKKLSIYDASGIMVDELNKHFPDIEYGHNTKWSLNISSTRCMLKTDNRFSFGWKLKYQYDRINRVTNIVEVTMVITAFGKDVINDQRTITEDGWIKIDTNKR